LLLELRMLKESSNTVSKEEIIEVSVSGGRFKN